MIKISDNLWLNPEHVQSIKFDAETEWGQKEIRIYMNGDGQSHWTFEDTPAMKSKIKRLFGLK